jgi:hypothetical protein
MSFGIPVRNGLAIGLLSSTTLSSNGGLFPAMALDFLQPYLDSRVTFSRGSNATLVDSTGRITYAPANLLLQSQTFENATWQKTTTTVTANTTVAPDGTSTADTLTATAGAGTHYIRQQPAVTASTAYALSFYVKAGTHNFIQLLNAGDAQAFANFDIANGVVGTAGTKSTSSIISAGDGWYRCTVVFDNTAVLTNDFRIYIVSSASATFGQNWTTTGTETVFIWGAQLEPLTYQTVPGTYNATTTAAYYGPRFDYDPVTLAAKGLLIEEQRTNICFQSENFSVSWSASSLTVTTNTTVAPDGTTTADTLTATTTSGIVSQSPTFTGDGTKSVSVFLKAGTSGTTLFFLRDVTALVTRGSATITWTGGVPSAVASSGGTIEAVENYGNGWYRIKLLLAGVIAANSNSLRIQPDSVAGTGTVIAWGAQAENGSFATSYIPTVASQVTRSADVATMTGTNFSSWYNQNEGTFVASYDSAAPASRYAISASDGTSSNLIGIEFSSATTVRGRITTAGVSQASMTAGSAISAGQVVNAGLAYETNSAITASGGALSSEDTSVTLATLTQLSIGAILVSNFLNGHIRQIAYFNTRLPDAQLQALTAPPLITTLSLDFINGIYDA